MEKTTGLANGGVRYAQLTQEQYDAGVEYASSNGVAVEYGERFSRPGRPPISDAWGRYITSLAGVDAGLEAALGVDNG